MTTFVALATALAAQAPSPGDVVGVEIRTARNQVWIEQSVDVTVRIALDREFFAEQAVPILQHRVDLPVQLVVPWLENSDDQVVLLHGREGPRLAVGDRVANRVARCVALGTELRAGRTFDLFEVRCTWVGLVAREHVLAPAVVRYAYASAFEETLLGGRQPVDRSEAAVESEALRFEVRELPRTGRPVGFTGAVGEFTIGAIAAVSVVEVGDSLAITMTVQGAGNLDRFAAPPWPQWSGMVIQGLAERRDVGARKFVFDVLALTENAPPPSLSFAFFSPTGNEYRLALAGPVDLRIVPRADGRPLSPRVAKLLAARADAPTSGIPWWLFLIAVAIPVALLLRRRQSTVPGS